MTNEAAKGRSVAHLAAWGVVLLAVIAIARTVFVALSTASEHGYPQLPTTPNALAAWRDAASGSVVLALAALAAILLPLQRLGRNTTGVLKLARAWGVVGALAVWILVGLHLNRFVYGTAWRTKMEVGDLLIPAAATEPRIWYSNVGLTLACAILGLTLVFLFERFLPRLRAVAAPRGLAAGAGIALGLLAPLALLPSSLVASDEPRGDVILISIDALRVDRIGAYGNERGLTPSLDALAADAVRFDRAYCQEPWTLTSHMSMLTGLYPDAHGLNFGSSLAGEVWTLPEILRDAGYRTAGSVYDCYLLNPDFGYGAGFDRYEETQTKAMPRAERAGAWVAEDERAGFLFLHFYDPHTDTGSLPYEAGDEYLERFAPGAAEAFEGWARTVGASEALHQVNMRERPLSDEQRAAIGPLYDAGVAETDAAVGRFLDRLRAEGRYDDALIVVVSDHGEALGEAEHFMHELLLEETVRVPLFVKWPGNRDAGTVRDDLVETVDLLPTVLGALDLPAAEIAQGVDLGRGPSGRTIALHRSGLDYAATHVDGWRLHHRWSEERGVESSGLHRVDQPYEERKEGLASDAARLDLFVGPLAELHRANAVLAARFQGGEIGMSQADEDLLRSLGYIE